MKRPRITVQRRVGLAMSNRPRYFDVAIALFALGACQADLTTNVTPGGGEVAADRFPTGTNGAYSGSRGPGR